MVDINPMRAIKNNKPLNTYATIFNGKLNRKLNAFFILIMIK